MSFGHSRRQFLQGSTALAVTAFLPGSRAWAT
ncbi:twin-arginine translocation signal domain-containing protein, partial [Candidatus Entotheonella palauensis]